MGSGDPHGMHNAHAQAAGMGGMRAGGDLVARMQMTRGMRLEEAKEYVAGKLGVTTFDLSDPTVMTEVRNERGFGRIHTYAISQPWQANMIEAKFRICEVLGIPINCVEQFRRRTGQEVLDMSVVGESRIPTRLGDGALVEMTRSELRAEIEEGTQAAAKRAKVPPLTEDELAHLLDIFASPAAFVSVEQGDQLILSCDGTGSQIASSRLEDLREWEATLGSDLVELYHVDYSYKAIKTIRHVEQQAMRNVQLLLTVPVQYGAMPNLGLYSRPDGPVPNWSELMPQGRIEEARASQEEAVEMAVEDMVFVGEGMWEAGTDGIDFDTAGAAGDADFLATLRAVEELRRRCPDIGIELGMAAEFVLGMHGELSYDGVRLAGLWPKDQARWRPKPGRPCSAPPSTSTPARPSPGTPRAP